jgi:hypothetical protein
VLTIKYGFPSPLQRNLSLASLTFVDPERFHVASKRALILSLRFAGSLESPSPEPSCPRKPVPAKVASGAEASPGLSGLPFPALIPLDCLREKVYCRAVP